MLCSQSLKNHISCYILSPTEEGNQKETKEINNGLLNLQSNSVVTWVMTSKPSLLMSRDPWSHIS